MILRTRCLCGRTPLSVQGTPVARAYCHCGTCRDTYATAVLAATAWDADAVTIDLATTGMFQHPHKQLSKTFCSHCGDALFGTNRLGLRVVPNALIARATGGTLPDAFAPTLHLFYRERSLDVVDALPKYLEGWDGPTYDASAQDQVLR